MILDENRLVEMMVGRDIKDMYPKREVKIGDIVMDVKNLKADGFQDISFNLKKGEILGIFGLIRFRKDIACQSIVWCKQDKSRRNDLLTAKGLMLKVQALQKMKK